jgi:hypothetical protein
LEYGQAADLGAEVFVLTGYVGQRGGAFAQQQRVEGPLVGADESAQLGWHGEGDQVIEHRQEALALAIEPLGGVGMAAPGTRAVIARVIGIVLLPTLALAS